MFAPPGFGGMVRDYFNWERCPGLEKIVVFDHAFLEEPMQLRPLLDSYFTNTDSIHEKLFADLDLIDIQSVPVRHCKDAYALIVKHATIGTIA